MTTSMHENHFPALVRPIWSGVKSVFVESFNSNFWENPELKVALIKLLVSGWTVQNFTKTQYCLNAPWGNLIKFCRKIYFLYNENHSKNI